MFNIATHSVGVRPSIRIRQFRFGSVILLSIVSMKRVKVHICIALIAVLHSALATHELCSNISIEVSCELDIVPTADAQKVHVLAVDSALYSYLNMTHPIQYTTRTYKGDSDKCVRRPERNPYGSAGAYSAASASRCRRSADRSLCRTLAGLSEVGNMGVLSALPARTVELHGEGNL